MTVKPIPFTGPMVLALLAGRKTMTRRVLKPQPASEDLASELLEDYELRGWECFPDGDAFAVVKRLPYAPGDLLWCRETWCHGLAELGQLPAYYRADGEDDCTRWRPSIHMPRWASRLTLRVTDVRVQRVQEISEGDAIAEGACRYPMVQSARLDFRKLWNSINAKRPGCAWADNPWVAVIGFDVIRENIDAVLAREKGT